MKTKVYWSYGNLGSKDNISGYPPERLITDLKNNSAFKDKENSAMLVCPSTLALISNAYVLKAPFDINIVKHEDGSTEIQGLGAYFRANQHVQFHDVFSWVFYAEKSTIMSLYPPFLHPENLAGACGSYDISKWYRPVSGAVLMERFDFLPIKRGQVVAYIFFDKPVDFVRFELTQSLYEIGTAAATLKNVNTKNKLQALYDMASVNKIGKRVLREIKRNIL